jgi:hypothetical protein
MKLIKTLLVWLLLLALPLQGLAATAMNICSTGATAPSAVQTHCHVAKLKSVPSTPHHAAGESTVQAADSHCQDSAGPHKCSNCASCAFGAPCVPVSSLLVSAKPAGAEPIDYLPHHVTSRLPDGLERPPHSLAA